MIKRANHPIGVMPVGYSRRSFKIQAESPTTWNNQNNTTDRISFDDYKGSTATETPSLQSTFIPSPRKDTVHGVLDLGTVLDRIMDQPLLHAVPERLHRRVFARERRQFQSQQPRHLLVGGLRESLQAVDLLRSDHAAVRRAGLRALEQRAQLSHCDEEGYGDLAQELEHLEREVWRAEFRRDEQRIDQSAQSRRKLRPGHDVEFDGEQGGHDGVAPELASL